MIQNACMLGVLNYWLQWGRHEDLSTWKSHIHWGHKAEVNISFKGKYILMSTEIEVTNCFVIINMTVLGDHANQISMCLDPYLNLGWGWRRETGLSPQVIDRSKAALLFWIIYVFLFCVWYAFCARLLICALCSPAEKELTSWLSFVVSNCEFVPFQLISWVRCGTWLYQFLIFAPLLIFNNEIFYFYFCCWSNVHP